MAMARTTAMPVPATELSSFRASLARKYGADIWEGEGKRVLLIRVPRASPDPVNDVEAAVDYLSPEDLENIQQCFLMGDESVAQIYVKPLQDLMVDRIAFDRRMFDVMRTRLPAGLAHSTFQVPEDPRRRWRLAVRVPVAKMTEIEEHHLDDLAEGIGPQLDTPRFKELVAVYLIGEQDAARIDADLFLSQMREKWTSDEQRRRAQLDIAAKLEHAKVRRIHERDALIEQMEQRLGGTPQRVVASTPTEQASAPAAPAALVHSLARDRPAVPERSSVPPTSPAPQTRPSTALGLPLFEAESDIGGAPVGGPRVSAPRPLGAPPSGPRPSRHAMSVTPLDESITSIGGEFNFSKPLGAHIHAPQQPAAGTPATPAASSGGAIPAPVRGQPTNEVPGEPAIAPSRGPTASTADALDLLGAAAVDDRIDQFASEAQTHAERSQDLDDKLDALRSRVDQAMHVSPAKQARPAAVRARDREARHYHAEMDRVLDGGRRKATLPQGAPLPRTTTRGDPAHSSVGMPARSAGGPQARRLTAAEIMAAKPERIETGADPIDALVGSPLGRRADASGLAPGHETPRMLATSASPSERLHERLEESGFDIMDAPDIPGIIIDVAAERARGDPQRLVVRFAERLDVQTARELLKVARDLDVDMVLCVTDQPEPEGKRLLVATKIKVVRSSEVGRLSF